MILMRVLRLLPVAAGKAERAAAPPQQRTARG